LFRFIIKQESLLENFETKNSRILEYAGSTNTGNEKVNIELKVSSNEIPKGKGADDFKDEVDSIKSRVKKIRYYIAGWRRSEFIESLDKAHVSFVIPPIRKTNVILKNPNFQIAMKLWAFLQNYNSKDDDNSKEGLDTEGDNILKGVLDDSFLMNYVILDSICSSKKEQKEKLAKYAVIMINQQIKRIVSLLLNSGVEIADEEILGMVSIELNNERSKRLVGSEDVKKKFKNAMDEYLERAQDYM
jgi:hypothetical protein